MLYTKVLLKSKSQKGLEVREATSGRNLFIPLSRLKGFKFHEDCMDAEDHLPKVNQEYPAVMKDENIVYLDRSDSEFWNYTPEGTEQTENEWLPIIRRLLELSQIGSLTPELTNEMLQLYRKKQYNLLKEKLIKECQLFDYLMSGETQFHENKSSLVFPAGFQKGDILTQECRNAQLDELSQALVGAANAHLTEDFHLVVGVRDDKELDTHLYNEIEQYFGGSVQNFIDVFTNRLNQIVKNPAFTASLHFEPIELQGKMVLDIIVPHWSGEILDYKNNIYVRIQSTTCKLEGMNLVNYMYSIMKK